MNSTKNKLNQGNRGLQDEYDSKAKGINVLQRIAHSSTLKMKRRESQLVDCYQQRNQGKLVSIIMPTWNRVKVIKRAIDSVMNQSYRNFELIVSDDGSTDGTGDFIRSEYGNSSRLTFIHNKHRGVSYTRNSALDKSNGQLIAYLDSDNQWGANYLMVMVNALEDSPGKSCAYCGLRLINEIQGTKFTRLASYDRTSLIERNYIDMNIFIHSRDLFDRNCGFAHNLEPLEDWELILRYTQDNSPLVVECCLANYYISRQLNHQSLICEADSSYRKIQALYRNQS